MATKERFQNPVISDTVNLRFFTYNSNNRTNVDSISKVEIYYLDPDEVTDENPDGRRLIETIDAADVTLVETGQYLVSVDLVDAQYVIGNYIDIWYVAYRAGEGVVETEPKYFEVYPDLWYTSVAPVIYDFMFRFQPNRLRRGSKQYLIIQIKPNVRHASELEEYYTNLAIASPLKIYIEQECLDNDCVPAEEDLRLVVDGVSVDYREKCLGYYFLDTSEDGLDMSEGLYNVYFEMEFGESTYLSDKLQLQIY
jgi:hypothetical protein